MRFTLLSLLAFVTILSAALAVVIAYGVVGAVLCIPHFGAFVLILGILRRRHGSVAAIIGASYIACWFITGALGAPGVRERVAAQLMEERFASETVLLSHEPQLETCPPWLFVGNESSPCPFVVRVDYGLMQSPPWGCGGTIYVGWFFGYTYVISENMRWTM
jgi:hypothetical protein